MSTHQRLGRAVALIAVGTLALAGCGADSPADEEETYAFTVGTIAVDGTPSAAVQEWFLAAVEEASEGRIEFERTGPEAICKAAEIVECVRDGRLDVGVSVPAYTPQFFPEAEIVGIPFIGTSVGAVQAAYAAAYAEVPEIQDIYGSNGLVRITNWSPGRLLLGTKSPVDGPEDLAGLSIRVTGPITQVLFKDTGANIVALTAGEAYEGIERGVADALAGAIDFPTNFKLGELLGNWVDPGVGHFTTFAMWMNPAAYESLPEDLRAVVDGVITEFNTGAGLEGYSAAVAVQCEQLDAFSTVTSIGVWDEAVVDAWRDATFDDLKQQWIDTATAGGFTSAEAFLDAYENALDDYSGVPDPIVECLPAIAR
jgi:TRAP-type C4-dicarboxylate transport system substrate-binding protein